MSLRLLLNQFSLQVVAEKTLGTLEVFIGLHFDIPHYGCKEEPKIILKREWEILNSKRCKVMHYFQNIIFTASHNLSVRLIVPTSKIYSSQRRYCL